MALEYMPWGVIKEYINRMKKLIALFALVLMSTAFALTVPSPIKASAANGVPDCTVTPMGNPSEGEHYGNFIVEDNEAKLQYNVSGPKNCQSNVYMKAYLAPAANGEPHDQQELQAKNEKTVTPGTGHIKINMLPNGCFYQIDFGVKGAEKQSAFKLGGKRNCIVPTTNTCDLLTPTKLSRTSYAYQAKASATGRATLTGFSYNFGDGKTATSANGATSHEYAAPGTYTVIATANFAIKAQFDGDGKNVSYSSPACTTTVTVDQPAAYECSALTATPTGLYSYKYAVKYTTTGVSLKNVDFNFGDGTTQNAVTDLANVNHTYAKAGTYTSTATLHFTDANGQAVSDVNCSAKTVIEVCANNPQLPVNDSKCNITPPTTPPTTTTPPAELVHTGPASVVGIFAAVAIIGAAAHNMMSRRRQA